MAIPRLGKYVEDQDDPTPAGSALHTVTDTALDGLKQIVGLFDHPDGQALQAQLDECRTELLAGRRPAALDPLTARCTTLCRQAIATISAQRNAERRETASLLVAIQEAVDTLSGDTRAFHADLKRSTGRFEEIATLNQILELKTRLTAEVRVLKSKTVEGERAWQHSIEALGRRIASLELQLSASRQEGAIDPLTQVFNRGAFDKRCQEWLNSGLIRFTILMFDVDDFKVVNDTHGHPEGDRVLVTVAGALKATVRSGQDVVARIGGDEFAVMAMDMSLRGADALYKRIAQALRDAGDAQEPPLPSVSLSCGAAEYSAGDNGRSLMQRADEALYEAKRRGKGRAVVREKPLLRDL